MEVHGWWWYHTLGWWVWFAATVLFALALVWSRRSANRTLYVPWIFLSLFLVSSVAHYLRSDWGRYSNNPMVWWPGLGSIVAVSALPLLVCLLADSALLRVVSQSARRAALAAATGLVAAFLGQPFVAHQVSMLILRMRD